MGDLYKQSLPENPENSPENTSCCCCARLYAQYTGRVLTNPDRDFVLVVPLTYIGISGPETSEERVAMRGSQGRHDVPSI